MFMVLLQSLLYFLVGEVISIITIRDWTEFSDEVEEFRRSYCRYHDYKDCSLQVKYLFNSIKSQSDIECKEYAFLQSIEFADDILKIEACLYEFGIAIVKAIDDDTYKVFNMKNTEVDQLIKKFRKYVKDAELRRMRFNCQD